VKNQFADKHLCVSTVGVGAWQWTARTPVGQRVVIRLENVDRDGYYHENNVSTDCDNQYLTLPWVNLEVLQHRNSNQQTYTDAHQQARHKYSSAFYPSGVCKSSTSLPGWGLGSTCSPVLGGRSDRSWQVMFRSFKIGSHEGKEMSYAHASPFTCS